MLLNCGPGEDSRVTWTARRSNQSILKEISSKNSLEVLMLKLKLQYFGHLMRWTDSLEKTLMLGKIEGRRRRGWPSMRWLDGITDSMDMSWETPGFHDGQGGLVCIAHGVAKSQTPLSDWIDWLIYICDKVEHSYIWYNCYCSVNKLCPVLCNPMDCSLPYSSVHEISQARILECVAISFPRGSSQHRNQTHICCFADSLLHCRQILYCWATLVI